MLKSIYNFIIKSDKKDKPQQTETEASKLPSLTTDEKNEYFGYVRPMDGQYEWMIGKTFISASSMEILTNPFADMSNDLDHVDAYKVIEVLDGYAKIEWYDVSDNFKLRTCISQSCTDIMRYLRAEVWIRFEDYDAKLKLMKENIKKGLWWNEIGLYEGRNKIF